MKSSSRLAGLTRRERWRRTRLRAYSGTLTRIYHAASLRPALWRVMARGYHPAFDRIAARHALLACRLGSVDIPAYRDLLLRSGFLLEHAHLRARRLADFPETSKQNYAGRYDEASRCPGGRMYRPGVIVDESSGSTGRPYNWVRGPQELKAIYRNVAGYVSLVFPGEKLFVINAYSMGAWATGTTTGNALSRIAMVKNTGPDLEKIVDTLMHFGPGYDYIVTAYPPFLKHLRDRLDAAGFDWGRYRLRAMVGGEGMTEALRDYLEERFGQVRSGYGASDLTIGIAAETNFTVWLRKQLAADRELRRELLGPGEQRLPMIFHYNPLETYLEVNGQGEIVCTINPSTCLQPKLRYNVGDEGMLLPARRVEALVARDPGRWAGGRAGHERMNLPLLLVFGRKDSTISYMGANLYPQDVEYGLYASNPMAAEIERFSLSLAELPGLESRPVVNIELRPGADLGAGGAARLAARCRDGVLAHLTRVSRDFAESLSEDPAAADLQVRVFSHGEGPFRGTGTIKNVYLTKEPA